MKSGDSWEDEIEGPRWTRAVEDQSAPTPEEITGKLGWKIYFVRRAQSRIDQATLENELVDNSCSGGDRERPECPSCSQNAHEKDGKSTHVGPVLPERAP